MLQAIFQYQFLQNALIAGILAGIICGIMGVIITEKKMLMISGGIAHTAYGGIGLGFFLGIEPIIGASIFSVGAALIIGKINRAQRVQSDTVISLLWALGMALGVAFTGLMPSYPPDMNSYLFGNILSVSRGDIYAMLLLCAVILLAVISLFADWKAFLFDRSFADVMGIRTAILEYALLILTALCVVVLIRVVGIILVIALLSAPAACSALFSRTLKGRLILSVAFTLLFCLAGLCISYYFNIASGAAIVILAVVTYFILYILKRNKA